MNVLFVFVWVKTNHITELKWSKKCVLDYLYFDLFDLKMDTLVCLRLGYLKNLKVGLYNQCY